MTTSKLPIFKAGNKGGLRYASNCTFNSLHGVIRCSHTDQAFQLPGEHPKMEKHFLLRISPRGKRAPVLRETIRGVWEAAYSCGICLFFKWSECCNNLLDGGYRGKSLGWTRSTSARPRPEPHGSVLPHPLPVTWRRPHRATRDVVGAVTPRAAPKPSAPHSARARRLPGAPAPWRRYLGCRSGGTWRRPQVPGSGAGCGSGTGRRIQEVAAPPARHLPATLRPAPSTSRLRLQA